METTFNEMNDRDKQIFKQAYNQGELYGSTIGGIYGFLFGSAVCIIVWAMAIN
jgi:hypothetical protein